MTQPEPRLSVVAAARNDGHGGDLLDRLRLCVDGLAEQCARHDLEAELVLVEWNPPADRPRLREALDWPAPRGRLTARIVEVPCEVHDRLACADRLAFFQMIAKNVGIRRARGRFVLATNVDVLFPDALVSSLAGDRLSPRRFYRADRHDVPAEIPLDAPLEEKLAFCERNVVRTCTREGTLDRRTGVFYPIYSRPTALVPRLAQGLERAPHAIWRRIVVRAHRLRRLLAPRRPTRARLARGLRLLADMLSEPPESRRSRGRERRERRERRRATLRLHTNACGDFTLMAREDWHALRGYPELEIFSLHIDSLLLYVAHYSGLREMTLPHPVFHIEHASGFLPDENARRSLYERLERDRIPVLTNEQFGAYAIAMRRARRPTIENGENWGFAGEAFPETVVEL